MKLLGRKGKKAHLFLARLVHSSFRALSASTCLIWACLCKCECRDSTFSLSWVSLFFSFSSLISTQIKQTYSFWFSVYSLLCCLCFKSIGNCIDRMTAPSPFIFPLVSFRSRLICLLWHFVCWRITLEIKTLQDSSLFKMKLDMLFWAQSVSLVKSITVHLSQTS